jgi:hypothetical protein
MAPLLDIQFEVLGINRIHLWSLFYFFFMILILAFASSLSSTFFPSWVICLFFYLLAGEVTNESVLFLDLIAFFSLNT